MSHRAVGNVLQFAAIPFGAVQWVGLPRWASNVCLVLFLGLFGAGYWIAVTADPVPRVPDGDMDTTPDGAA